MRRGVSKAAGIVYPPPWSDDEFSYVIRETGGIIVMLPKFIF